MKRFGMLGLIVLVAWSSPVTSLAQVSSWNNANGGVWQTASNWSGGLPGLNSTALFDVGTGSSYSVALQSSETVKELVGGSGSARIWLQGNTLSVHRNLFLGGVTGDNAQSLTFLGGTVLSSGLLRAGGGSDGTLRVGLGADFQHAGDTQIGFGLGDEGTIQVRDGGQAEFRGRFSVPHGSLVVEGAGSQARVNTIGSTYEVIELGGSASSTVTVRSQGSLESAGRIILGTNHASHGVVSDGGAWVHDGLFGFGTAGGSAFVNGGHLELRSSGLSLQAGQALHVWEGHFTATTPSSSLQLSGGELEILSGHVVVRNFAASSGNLSLAGGTLGGSLEVRGGNLTSNLLPILGTNSAFKLFLTEGAVGGLPEIRMMNASSIEVVQGSKFSTTNVFGLSRVEGGGQLRIEGIGSQATFNHTLRVGENGKGTLHVANGGVLQSSSIVLLGTASGVDGSATVSGGGQLLANGFYLASATGSTATATVQDGGLLRVNNLYVGGIEAFARGNGDLIINSGGTVEVAGTTLLWNSPGSSLTINGGRLATSSLERQNTLTFHDGNLEIVGGVFTNGTTPTPFNLVGNTVDASPTLVLKGAATTANVTGTTLGSATRQGTLRLEDHSHFTADGALTLNARGRLELAGGSLSLQSLVAGGGTVDWQRGAVRFTSTQTLTSSVLTALLGSGRQLLAEQTLQGNAGTTLTLGASLELAGGSLVGDSIINNATLRHREGSVAVATFTNNAGRLAEVLSGTFTASTGMTNHGTLQLGGVSARVEGGQLTNSSSGIVGGTGTIANSLVNNGTVRVEADHRLTLAGAAINNLNIDLSGGIIDVVGTLTNGASGAISGRGSLRTSSATPGGLGLVNQGVMLFSGGFSDVRGDVQNLSTGRIVAAGASLVTFFDDVVHNGIEIRTFADSRIVFLGERSGSGAFTGSGVVEYAGDFRPGNSPGQVLHEGDVEFASTARLFVELGGTLPGLDYDQLVVLGDLTLSGQLFVSWIGSEQAMVGQEFTLIDLQSSLGAVGTFAGLAEGSEFTSEGVLWRISYQGGDGNDVVLSVAAVPEPGTALLVSSAAAVVFFAGRRKRR